VGMGMNVYFADRFNCFDCSLVAFGIVGAIADVALEGSSSGRVVRILFRMFRVARLLRLAGKKSTLGILLAKELGMGFVDTDVAIQVREGQTLQEILDASDYLNLRAIEEQVLLPEQIAEKVVATGGSAVYSDAGMARLRENATLIFLDVPLRELEKRISNFNSRGIARKPDQSLESLYKERCKLYRKYADITVDCDQQLLEQTLQSTLQQLP